MRTRVTDCEICILYGRSSIQPEGSFARLMEKTSKKEYTALMTNMWSIGMVTFQYVPLFVSSLFVVPKGDKKLRLFFNGAILNRF